MGGEAVSGISLIEIAVWDMVLRYGPGIEVFWMQGNGLRCTTSACVSQMRH
jgi:hypothetical protein